MDFPDCCIQSEAVGIACQYHKYGQLMESWEREILENPDKYPTVHEVLADRSARMTTTQVPTLEQVEAACKYSAGVVGYFDGRVTEVSMVGGEMHLNWTSYNGDKVEIFQVDGSQSS